MYHRITKKAKSQHRDRRWSSYRNLQNELRSHISSAYEKYINSLFEDDLSDKPDKKFWNSIKAKNRDHVGIPPLCKNCRLVTSSKEKARVLKEQYQNVFIDEDLENIPVKTFQFLQKLNPKKATGPDLVPTWGLKDYDDDYPIFQKIFQQSLDAGQVADDW